MGGQSTDNSDQEEVSETYMVSAPNPKVEDDSKSFGAAPKVAANSKFFEATPKVTYRSSRICGFK